MCRFTSVAILSLCWLFTSSCGGPSATELRVSTISILNRTYVGIVVLEDKYKKSVTDMIESDPQLRTIGLNRGLSLLFEKDDIWIASKTAHQDGRVTPLQLLDPYGNPLVCISRTDAIKQKLPSDLIGRKRSVIVYSVGPNGKDDHAAGDDVYWPEP